jgi:hypothetical protein
MNRKLHILLALCCACIPSIAVSIGVPPVEEHIAQSKDILVGTFESDQHGNVYFLVKITLKGDVVVFSKALINSDSRLAWSFLPGGKIVKPIKSEFISEIEKREWFGSTVILLGSFKNGLWVSEYYDWSVWPNGEIDFKGRSVKDISSLITEKLKSDSARQPVSERNAN